MPWTGQSFHRHNQGLSPAESAHAARIANHVLRSTGNDGEAIATANKLIHRVGGGMVPATTMASLQTPQNQGLLQRFSALSPEQLRELIPRLGGSPVAQIAQRVLQQKQMAPQQQPTQAAPALPQYGVPAQTGAQPPAQSQPVAAQARGGHTGMAPRETVPILAAGGEFVISPEHVARLGDGDISEGHRRLDAWVVRTRGKIVEKMKSLKPPVKS